MTNIELIDALSERGALELNEWTQLLSEPAEQEREYAADRARTIAQREFGRNIYIRCAKRAHIPFHYPLKLTWRYPF